MSGVKIYSDLNLSSNDVENLSGYVGLWLRVVVDAQKAMYSGYGFSMRNESKITELTVLPYSKQKARWVREALLARADNWLDAIDFFTNASGESNLPWLCTAMGWKRDAMHIYQQKRLFDTDRAQWMLIAGERYIKKEPVQ